MQLLISKNGKFIVVEGLEGAGKSTLIEFIANYLKSHVLSVITTRDPGGTAVGEQIRGLIKNSVNNEPVNKYTELLLLYAARVQLIDRVIRPALDSGAWVLADRFELSTYAYQGGGRGIDHAVIQQLSIMLLQGTQPDLIFFLDLLPEQGLQRVKLRGLQQDRIEQESLEFFNNIYQAYHQLIATMSNVVIVDAQQPIHAIQQFILPYLEQLIHVTTIN